MTDITMIDITLFYIIKPEQLNTILNTLNIPLDTNLYFINLILANIFAYFIIVLFTIGVIYIIHRARKRVRRTLI